MAAGAGAISFPARVTLQALQVSLVPLFNGLTSPVFVTHAGDGTGRMFVVERAGIIKVAVNGQIQPTPFLDIQSLINSSGSEQGLLGLAFHPNYASNGRLYVYYTASNDDDTLARYQVSGNPNQANSASGSVLFNIHDDFANHNGGMLAFGPDGFLYVALGDEGSGGDPKNNAQNLNLLYGKLLRLNVDGQDPGLQYAIPASNPFSNQAGKRGEIWAYGLRNPWRFSFDRSTNAMMIGDVGQGMWEEVDYQPPGSAGGQNYGWNLMEGAHCFAGNPCSSAGLTLPVAEYSHAAGDCSITGGYVYRGTQSPPLVGAYLYADFCTGKIWTLRQNGGVWTSELLIDTTINVSSFGEDQAGEVYVVGLGGTVDRISVTETGPPPTATVAPTPTSTPVTPGLCSPRPNVLTNVTAAGAGVLNVAVQVQSTAATPGNQLSELRFRSTDNGVIDIAGQMGRTGAFTVAFPSGTQQSNFTVRRPPAGPGNPGAATTIQFDVVDICGAWPSFVGGGPNAF